VGDGFQQGGIGLGLSGQAEEQQGDDGEAGKVIPHLLMLVRFGMGQANL